MPNITASTPPDCSASMSFAALSMIFWDAIADADGTINFTATLRDGTVSASNPEWAGVAIVTGTDLGGQVDEIGVSTLTLPLLDRPTKNTGA